MKLNKKYDELYQCFNRRSSGVVGRSGDEWEILPGSRLAETDTSSYESTGKTRLEKFIEDGYVRDKLFIKEYPVKSRTLAVTILGRHFMSTKDALKKSRQISIEEAQTLLDNNQNGISQTESRQPLKIVGDENVEKSNDNDNVWLDELESLVTDEIFQKLDAWKNSVNIFDIVGQTHTEHWHSAFMKWLFDPNSSLELGTFPLERFIYLYIQKGNKAGLDYANLESLNLGEMEFETEKNVNAPKDYPGWEHGSIDVYGWSNSLKIIIENKVTANEEIRENKGQTQLYYDVEERDKEEQQTAIYFFVTPNPAQRPYCKEYVQVTYQELYEKVILKCIMNPSIKPECKYVLQQYSDNLRNPYNNKREKTKSPMALIHIEECEKIYDRYGEVLDVIFQKANDDNSLEYAIYMNHKEVFDEIYLSVEKYGKTPNSSMVRTIVSFDDLVRRGDIKEDETFTMQYNNNTYHAKLIKNEDIKEYCMALLDEKGNLYRDEEGKLDSKYSSYRRSSAAANDAVDLLLKKNGINKRPTSLNGKNYWRVDSRNILLNEII
jgi:hypothetical protein